MLKKWMKLTVILTATNGCAFFQTKLPDVVRNHMSPDDTRAYMDRPGMMHPDVWAENLHQFMLNRERFSVRKARESMDAAISSFQSLAQDIHNAEKKGIKFHSTTDSRGRLIFEILEKQESEMAQTVMGTFLPLLGPQKNIGESALHTVARTAKSLERHATPDIENLYFDTVTELASVRKGEELSFRLPDGISRDDYLDLLSVLVVRLDADYQELNTYKSALASTLAVLASLDSAKKGTVDNLYAVLGASLEDRARFEGIRKSLDTYPPSKEILAEMRTQATSIQTATLESKAYKTWSTKIDHYVNITMLESTAADLSDVVSSVSEVYGMLGGVDIVGKALEVKNNGLDIGELLDVGLKLVPSNGKLREILENGKKVYSSGEQVVAIINDPNAAIQNETNKLLAWVTPAEVEKAKKLIASIEKPNQ